MQYSRDYLTLLNEHDTDVASVLSNREYAQLTKLLLRYDKLYARLKVIDDSEYTTRETTIRANLIAEAERIEADVLKRFGEKRMKNGMTVAEHGLDMIATAELTVAAFMRKFRASSDIFNESSSSFSDSEIFVTLLREYVRIESIIQQTPRSELPYIRTMTNRLIKVENQIMTRFGDLTNSAGKTLSSIGLDDLADLKLTPEKFAKQFSKRARVESSQDDEHDDVIIDLEIKRALVSAKQAYRKLLTQRKVSSSFIDRAMAKYDAHINKITID